ncbi:hypothetical protein HMSSN036_23670 [Paenibacillus macerans]|nr:hypothetical protein HMSSN036_23670 [Paenibacillus macerans]
MKDTIIVGFGDHGDDLWTHALNNGFCHGIEPYTNMIWTPAFIYDASFEGSKDYNNLASLIDLRKTILHLLGYSESNSQEFSGIDLLNSKNDFVFSRNLFANQRDTSINATKPMGLKKAYAVLNKDYNLIATQFGLEMYAYRIDSTNHNNLLSFF